MLSPQWAAGKIAGRVRRFAKGETVAVGRRLGLEALESGAVPTRRGAMADGGPWAIIALIAVTVGVAALLRLAAREAPLTISLGGATLLSLVFAYVRYDATGRAFGVLLRALTVVIAAYLAASQPFFIVGGGEGGANHVAAVLLQVFFWVMLAAAVAAMLRPSFALLPFMFLIVLKSEYAASSGMGISATDYAILPEVGLFLTAGSVAIAVWTRGQPWRAVTPSTDRPDPRLLGDMLVYAAAAIHFANYFYAGFGKLMLPGPPLAWLGNHTPNILLASLLYKCNPLMQFGPVVDALYAGFSRLYPLTNAAVLFFQLACLWALSRRWLLIVFLLFFDAMHVGIFVSSGIFFWKWIVLNLIFALVLEWIGFAKAPRWLHVTGLVLVVSAPAFFSVARLAWFDTREVNAAFVQAVRDDGARVQLPSNFFLGYSVTFAQNRVGVALGPHFATGSLGSSHDYGTAVEAATCSGELLPAEAAGVGSNSVAVLRRFVAAFDRFARSRADTDGHLHYDLFPHHIWSNPAMYPEAAALDLRHVVGYELVVQAMCVGDVKTASDFNVLTKARTVIPIALTP